MIKFLQKAMVMAALLLSVTSQANALSESEAQARAQKMQFDFCSIFVPLAKDLSIGQICTEATCQEPNGINTCIQNLGNLINALDPSACSTIKSKLGPLCTNYCNKEFCANGEIKEVCKIVCCPLNREEISSCLENSHCPEDPLHCGGMPSKEVR